MSSFESRLNRLEEIGVQLKNGEIPIDEATTLFEEGMTLSRRLEKELQQMERRIEIVTSGLDDEETSPELSLFPTDEQENGDDSENKSDTPDNPL